MRKTGFKLLFLASLLLLIAIVPAFSKSARNATAIQVLVADAQGKAVAVARSAAKANEPAGNWTVERAYEPGDRLVITGPQYMMIRLDPALPEALVYSPQGKLEFEIPHGRTQQETGGPFPPDSFAGSSHVVVARAASKKEVNGYRNLALNPYDQQTQALHFPHATSNSVYKNWPQFQERNAIDGASAGNGAHGTWPYRSWGPDRREDLWWQVDFGRSVKVDKVRLVIRTDFPHDSYWKSAVLEFSDGSREPITITSASEFQIFAFRSRKTKWVRLSSLVPVDAKRYCALVEAEVLGQDLGDK